MQEYGFSITHVFPYKAESLLILSIYGKIRVRENLCSHIFYAMRAFILICKHQEY